MKRVLEHEIDALGNRTGATRNCQLTKEYMQAARTGLWPKDRSQIDSWNVPFTHTPVVPARSEDGAPQAKATEASTIRLPDVQALEGRAEKEAPASER